ncbi:FAD/NAD-P-binding domain-containing protein [Lentinula raphanica]|nr:FAD/NAD-P-binding domain-containing protein [Lentinula raphanica]
MKVVIVGAGPSGLVIAKSLLENADANFPFDPVILEQEHDIGGTFRYRTYEDAHLVSSKQLTSFSDFRAPPSFPDHPSAEAYVYYLRSYIDHFNLSDRIRLNTKVINIKRNSKGGHLVSYVTRDSKDSEWSSEVTTIHAPYIAICTGLHVLPYIPSIPGIEHVVAANKHIEKPVYHSSEYKKRSELEGKRIMIIGSGETGMDLAYGAAKAGAKEVVLCSQEGFLSFPNQLNDFELFGYKSDKGPGIPLDSLITNLAESAYVHPWVEASHLRWFISDFFIKRLMWVLTGTQAGCNQWVGEREPHRLGRAYVFLNKSPRAMPYINRPYRKRSKFFDSIARYIDPPEDSPPQTNFTVDLAPFPTHFLPNGRAVFTSSKRKDYIRMKDRDVRPEKVIFATGYSQEFGFLDKESGYPTPDEANIRNVVKEGDESVGFIGFVRPGVGAIPPIAEMQSLFWISILKGQVRNPMPPPRYHLLVEEDYRIRYGVDHSTYVSTLAKDIGAAPGLWEIWREYGTHVLVCYCFGAAFTPFYRLVGPYKSASAPGIIKTELWDTILRRGFLGNLVMGVIPMVFYLSINCVAFVLGTMWMMVGGKVE